MREDRRVRRRNATVQEILDTAIEVMGEEGAAALSLAEVARRVGMRPPSLYQYFPSKLAIYDALFERGARQMVEVLEKCLPLLAEDPRRAIAEGQQAMLGWALANPVLAQLLYWRPAPGFEPSPQAFAPAVRQLEILRTALRAAVDAGQLAPAAAGEGRFIRLAPTGLDMFFRYFAPEGGASDVACAP